MNSKLKEKRNAIEDAYDCFLKMRKIPSMEQLRTEYINQLQTEFKEELPDFWVEYDKFIESSVGRVVNDVIKDYKSLKKHLKGFEKKRKKIIEFDSFDFAFYQNFVHYLSYDVEKSKVIKKWFSC